MKLAQNYDLTTDIRLNQLSMEILSDMKPLELDAIVMKLPLSEEDVHSRIEAANRGIEALHMQNKIIHMLQNESISDESRDLLNSLLVGRDDNV